jgi:hypothetical protein
MKAGHTAKEFQAYFRLDTRISLRKDKTKTAWILALDIRTFSV